MEVYMRKKQFLEELEESLRENNLSRDIISNNIKYYDEYITNKVKEGSSEDEVISELGSGRIIAKTIVDADKKGAKSSYYNTSYNVNLIIKKLYYITLQYHIILGISCSLYYRSRA